MCLDCGIWAPVVEGKACWPRVYTKFEGINRELPCEKIATFEVCDSPGMDEQTDDQLMEDIARAEISEANTIAVVFDSTRLQNKGQKAVFDAIRDVREQAQESAAGAVDQQSTPIIAVGNKADQLKDIDSGDLKQVIKHELVMSFVRYICRLSY